jgi:ribonuclease III
MRLHQDLAHLFDATSSVDSTTILNHQDHELFRSTWELEIPTQELVSAFTHSSFAHEFRAKDQERWEFLGDACLSLIMGHHLMVLYPGESEGKLSRLRSSLVNEKSLARLARCLDLGGLILLGKGEFRKKLYLQDVVLADTLEALVGQIYWFQGQPVAHTKVVGWFEQFMPEALELSVLNDFDAKSALQERSLSKFKSLPRYVSSPSEKGFLVEVWINEKLITQGEFNSKKLGQRELAAKIIKENLI